MDITSLNRDAITSEIDRCTENREEADKQIRLLFSPRKIDNENFKAVCNVFSKLKGNNFRTVVIVESSPGSAKRKLVMPSFNAVETHLGKVEANDRLRNDFADEDDDFFINDNAFDEDVSLYHQLVMLQCTLNNFDISHIQITDENSIIIKELSSALEEILASKNALLVCCCNLEKAGKEEIEKISDYLNAENDSALMNFLNSGESHVEGVGSYIAGLLVAKKWGLNIRYETDPETGFIQSGYAVVQNQPIIG